VIGPVIRKIIDSWISTLADALKDAGRDVNEANDLALLCVCSLEGAILVARVKKSTRPIDTVRTRVLALL
jgi:TetR/AcrR family transcriptional repressor of lmrAB and yxaGH operons